LNAQLALVPEAPKTRNRLGDTLVAAQIITQEELDGAIALQGSSKGPRVRIGRVLTSSGILSEEDLARGLARHLDLPFVELDVVVADPIALAEIPADVAIKYQIVPLRVVGSELFVAMADPTDVFALDDVRSLTGLRNLKVAVGMADAVQAAIERLYEKGLGTGAILARLGDAANAEVYSDHSPTTVDPLDKSDAAAAPIIALINGILADAIRNRATDIHIEPQAASVSVRYRVDGLLQEVMKVPKQVQAMVISRLKILAGMDISERRKPQAGRVTLVINGKELDSRASSIPTFNGEKFVLRLLRTGQHPTSMSELGLDDEQLRLVSLEMNKPQGLIVFTGPTGSGKTSTMYALLSQIKAPQRNIVTLEDPIEYQLDGVNQTQIDERAGISFASGLRTLLRQDPDVMLVGEIRDAETAEIAFHAANTGHLVLTSLHTNDAPSAATRLVDLGVEPFVIAGSLSMVIAQRLVRCVCSECAEPYEVSEETRTLLKLSPTELGNSTPKMGKGCMACAFTGYRGRMGVFEVMPVTAPMKEQITAQVSEGNISYLSRSAGVITIREAALSRAKQGVTTFEEVLRVTAVEGGVSALCPGCGAEVSSTFSACPFCQMDLAQFSCPSCSRRVEPSWSSCPFCRTALMQREGSDRVTDRAPGRPRILVIDDDPDSNASMGRVFSDFDVTSATTAEEGLRKATLERPDGIVLDLNLPDGSGTDVIRQLRSSVATSLIPVMMLTGTVDKSVEAENLRAGVDDFVTKPVNHENLRLRFDALLGRKQPLTIGGSR
jgi:type IV pilus assembly protein PilB